MEVQVPDMQESEYTCPSPLGGSSPTFSNSLQEVKNNFSELRNTLDDDKYDAADRSYLNNTFQKTSNLIKKCASEFSHLQDQLKNEIEKVERLEKTLRKVENDCRSKELELEEKDSTIQQKVCENQSLSNQLEDSKTREASLLDQNKSLHQNLDVFAEENSSLKAENKALNEQLSNYDNGLFHFLNSIHFDSEVDADKKSFKGRKTAVDQTMANNEQATRKTSEISEAKDQVPADDDTPSISLRSYIDIRTAEKTKSEHGTKLA